jgi:hypothetical protein
MKDYTDKEDLVLINNDWELFGTKYLSVFLGIFSRGGPFPQIGIQLIRMRDCDHWGWEFAIWLWLFNFEASIIDSRHLEDLES